MITASFSCTGTAATEIYTLSLHDALPISLIPHLGNDFIFTGGIRQYPGFVNIVGQWFLNKHMLTQLHRSHGLDRKSTRLNSSHVRISYAVFCLKKKTRPPATPHTTSHITL